MVLEHMELDNCSVVISKNGLPKVQAVCCPLCVLLMCVESSARFAAGM